MELTVLAEEVRLDLGSGSKPREGYRGVDLYAPDVDHRVNLFTFPWPWESDSVDAIHCSHFAEHIPACFVSGQTIPRDETDLDLWCAFFGECWRILKDGSTMTVVVPYLKSHRAFQDPTHRRFHCEESFNYLNRPWRESGGLAHYLGVADFDVVALDRVIPMDESLKNPEAASMRAFHYWNTTLDLSVKLIARKKRG